MNEPEETQNTERKSVAVAIDNLQTSCECLFGLLKELETDLACVLGNADPAENAPSEPERRCKLANTIAEQQMQVDRARLKVSDLIKRLEL